MTNSFKWDKVVRYTHWTVAFLFFANYFVTSAGSDIHQWFGYGVLTLVCLRLAWGLITSGPARLSTFLPSPRSAIAHIKDVFVTKTDDHVGHNPAGAIMIWLMWTGLLTTGISGYMLQSERFWMEDWVEPLHETAANLTFTCVCIHISAVIVMSKLTGRRYLQSMGVSHPKR